MPTNTTTPEAATTTTPATNTNTTPLSAMTGEEVASILVGLIRQNDGVLIQTKLENALRSTGYAAIANDMAQGKQALYTLLQSKGVTIQGNESISECCTLLNAACLTLNGCQLAEGSSWNMANMFKQNYGGMIRKIYSDSDSVGFGIYGNTVKEVNLPNVTSIPSGFLMPNAQGNKCMVTTIKIPSYTGDVSEMLSTYSSTGCLDTLHIEGGRQCYKNYSGYLFPVKGCYDMKPTGTITATTSYASWRPESPLLSNSQTICTKDEWDDPNEPQGGFSNNLQKFLWYFEYHFIPCFGTVTTSPVLSLYTTVYNAINSATSIAQPTKTLKQLLTDKGWEVASVS